MKEEQNKAMPLSGVLVRLFGVALAALLLGQSLPALAQNNNNDDDDATKSSEDDPSDDDPASFGGEGYGGVVEGFDELPAEGETEATTPADSNADPTTSTDEEQSTAPPPADPPAGEEQGDGTGSSPEGTLFVWDNHYDEERRWSIDLIDGAEMPGSVDNWVAWVDTQGLPVPADLHLMVEEEQGMASVGGGDHVRLGEGYGSAFSDTETAAATSHEMNHTLFNDRLRARHPDNPAVTEASTHSLFFDLFYEYEALERAGRGDTEEAQLVWDAMTTVIGFYSDDERRARDIAEPLNELFADLLVALQLGDPNVFGRLFPERVFENTPVPDSPTEYTALNGIKPAMWALANQHDTDDFVNAFVDATDTIIREVLAGNLADDAIGDRLLNLMQAALGQ